MTRRLIPRPLPSLLPLLLCLTLPALADNTQFNLKVLVERKGEELQTIIHFDTPLDHCQAYRYLTDYESSKGIPGVIDARATRLGDRRARVELDLQETVLFFPIRMLSVLEFTELPMVGTDFVQTKGDIESFSGSWRLEPTPRGTVFHYVARIRPNSALPLVVSQYFIDHSLRGRFAEIARIAHERKNLPVAKCD